MTPLSPVENAKRVASITALTGVKSGQTIGLGSGSTIEYAVEELGRRVKLGTLDISVVPTSLQMEVLALRHRLRVVDVNQVDRMDLAVDGADQVEEKTLNLIKGGGAALTREKIVDSVAKKVIIIVDETKLSGRLGGDQRVPVEILPFGHQVTLRKIREISHDAVMRESKGKVGPVVTDNGNLIVDAHFPRIRDPYALDMRVKGIPGVVETGLFIDLADRVYVGTKSGQVKVYE